MVGKQCHLVVTFLPACCKKSVVYQVVSVAPADIPLVCFGACVCTSICLTPNQFHVSQSEVWHGLIFEGQTHTHNFRETHTLWPSAQRRNSFCKPAYPRKVISECVYVCFCLLTAHSTLLLAATPPSLFLPVYDDGVSFDKNIFFKGTTDTHLKTFTLSMLINVYIFQIFVSWKE